MKQGTGKTLIGGSKREPKPRAVNPAAVADLGIANVRTTPAPSIHAGRGFRGPAPVAKTSHPSGSQGKRK